jgi:nucleotide-binding universal stress UspA family protein
VTKERVMATIHLILHPHDFTPCSQHALRLACSLARDENAKLVVLHVLEQSSVTYSGVAMAPPAPIQTPVVDREAAQAQLDRIESPIPGVTIERRLELGDPATAIVQVAKEINADLIVMGTHGRTALARLLMGSVAEKIVRKAHCPVLTVKLPMPDA